MSPGPPNPPGLALGLVAAAVAVPGLLLARHATLPGLFGTLVVLLALSIGGRNRPTIAGLPAAGVHLAGLGISLGAGFLMLPDRPFGPLWTLAFLGLAAPRLAWRLTPRARGLVLLFGLLALMGLARAVPRFAFGVGTALVLILGVLAVLTADAGTPTLRRRGTLLPLITSLGFACALLTGLGIGLPAAEPAVVAALSPWLGNTERRSGFSESDIELGQISEIITSDTVVMRIHGTADHLRGQVYSDYTDGRWRRRTLSTQHTPRAGDDGLLLIDASVRGREVLLEAEPEAGPPLFAPLGTRRLRGAPPPPGPTAMASCTCPPPGAPSRAPGASNTPKTPPSPSCPLTPRTWPCPPTMPNDFGHLHAPGPPPTPSRSSKSTPCAAAS